MRSTVSKDQGSDDKLPPLWQQVHAAIWLIGLAFLFWRGDIFPGILVLVAISGLAQAAMMAYVNRQKAGQELHQTRERHLPAHCPNCGGPINTQNVRWVGTHTAQCPYCGTPIKAIETPTPTA